MNSEQSTAPTWPDSDVALFCHALTVLNTKRSECDALAAALTIVRRAIIDRVHGITLTPWPYRDGEREAEAYLQEITEELDAAGQGVSPVRVLILEALGHDVNHKSGAIIYG